MYLKLLENVRLVDTALIYSSTTKQELRTRITDIGNQDSDNNPSYRHIANYRISSHVTSDILKAWLSNFISDIHDVMT